MACLTRSPTRAGAPWSSDWAPSTASVELAAPLDMSLAAVVQHLQVLEDSGLIHTEKKSVVCAPVGSNPAVLTSGEEWFARRRALWERRLDDLGELLAEKKAKQNEDDPRHIHARPHLRREHPRGLAGLEQFRATREMVRATRRLRELAERSLNLRVGGRGIMRGRMPTGIETSYVATFHVVVPAANSLNLRHAH